MSAKTSNIPTLFDPAELGTPATADLTPMLDTIFLIILLLLATLIHSSIVRGFPVNLPAVCDEAAVQKDNETIEISVDQAGEIYIAKNRVTFDRLATALNHAAVQRPGTRILVRADRSVAYGRVAAVLARATHSVPNRQVILVAKTGPAGDERKEVPTP